MSYEPGETNREISQLNVENQRLFEALLEIANYGPPLSDFPKLHQGSSIQAYESCDNTGDVAYAASYRAAAGLGDIARKAMKAVK